MFLTINGMYVPEGGSPGEGMPGEEDNPEGGIWIGAVLAGRHETSVIANQAGVLRSIPKNRPTSSSQGQDCTQSDRGRGRLTPEEGDILAAGSSRPW